MKYKCPEFLQNVKTPFEGLLSLQKEFPEKIIIGVDEVGRGPLAGPVVACAAVLNYEQALKVLALNDSKKLSHKKRLLMYNDLKSVCSCYAIASASVEEIDSLNILEADFLAMRRALEAIGFDVKTQPPQLPVEHFGYLNGSDVLIAVDGNLNIKGIDALKQMPIVKGDSKVASISAASVLAKVYRDTLMENYAKEYPMYGFEENAGYGTKKHLEAIKKYGITKIHRKSFHPKALQTEIDFI